MQMCQRKDAAVNCVGTGDDSEGVSDSISGEAIERVTLTNTTTAIITITATIFTTTTKTKLQLKKYNKT